MGKMILFTTLSLITNFITASVALTADKTAQSSQQETIFEDLTSRLLANPVHQTEVYSRAVEILESIEAAPSCHRLATTSLIDSCQALERSRSSEHSLTKVRETYAARLAMCELSSAKVEFPTSCRSFVPSQGGCKRKTPSRSIIKYWRAEVSEPVSVEKLCYPELTASEVKQCLGALHSKPQWWTSYSNALQNVLVVCQASRNAIEKGMLA